jgi:hypothetical protein
VPIIDNLSCPHCLLSMVTELNTVPVALFVVGLSLFLWVYFCSSKTSVEDKGTKAAIPPPDEKVDISPVVEEDRRNVADQKVSLATHPSKAKLKALAVRNQTNKFKNLSALSDSVKTSCNCLHREIGGHSQAIVDFAFSLNGSMVATIGELHVMIRVGMRFGVAVV